MSKIRGCALVQRPVNFSFQELSPFQEKDLCVPFLVNFCFFFVSIQYVFICIYMYHVYEINVIYLFIYTFTEHFTYPIQKVMKLVFMFFSEEFNHARV